MPFFTPHGRKQTTVQQGDCIRSTQITNKTGLRLTCENLSGFFLEKRSILLKCAKLLRIKAYSLRNVCHNIYFVKTLTRVLLKKLFQDRFRWSWIWPRISHNSPFSDCCIELDLVYFYFMYKKISSKDIHNKCQEYLAFKYWLISSGFLKRLVMP